MTLDQIIEALRRRPRFAPQFTAWHTIPASIFISPNWNTTSRLGFGMTCSFERKTCWEFLREASRPPC